MVLIVCVAIKSPNTNWRVKYVFLLGLKVLTNDCDRGYKPRKELWRRQEDTEQEKYVLFFGDGTKVDL